MSLFCHYLIRDMLLPLRHAAALLFIIDARCLMLLRRCLRYAYRYYGALFARRCFRRRFTRVMPCRRYAP